MTSHPITQLQMKSLIRKNLIKKFKKKINSQQMELKLDTYFTLVTNIQNHLIALSIIKMEKKAL